LVNADIQSHISEAYGLLREIRYPLVRLHGLIGKAQRGDRLLANRTQTRHLTLCGSGLPTKLRHDNVDNWNSNGSVFSGRAFTKFWLGYCDTLLACYALFKIDCRQLAFPDYLESIAGNAGSSWQGLAKQAIEKYAPLP
jgi:hypothetical protein